MNKLEPRHIKEASDYLDWKLEYMKKKHLKQGFLKRILKKLFS